KALLNHVERCGIKIFRETRFSHIEKADNCWHLTVQKNKKAFDLQAQFVVDATGRKSYGARLLQKRQIEYDRLIAVLSYASPAKGTSQFKNHVLVEAMQSGWFYSSCLNDGRLVVNYMTDADILKDSRKNPLDFMNYKLQESVYTKERASCFHPFVKARICSAKSQLLSQITGEGWLAAGDAAMSCDPLSSSGILKGLKAGIEAAEAISRYFDKDCQALEDYERQVKEAFNEYLDRRTLYYGLENRWPDSIFWKRRYQVFTETGSLN
ncbi:MAG: tryptophan 7-halogenase, partial [Nitrospinae bacterium]|nr:tryptophan 7-halogenase [Nitrospinota bacterium]